LTRISARFVFNNYVVRTGSHAKEVIQRHLSVVKRTLFSRSLRLLPLPQQIGVLEGLAAIVVMAEDFIPLSDQHLLAFLSEMLQMTSVADGEITDPHLREIVVDKHGFTKDVATSDPARFEHSSALFFRRDAAVTFGGATFIVPGEVPCGVQLRISSILLLHAIVKAYTDDFFDAEAATSVGKDPKPFMR
jgi:hypothetical protein